MTVIWSGGIDNASVFPTENDVHGNAVALTGSVATEAVFPPLMAYCGGQMNRIISGFNLPANGTTNTAVHLDAGICVIDGYLVRCDTTQSIQIAASNVNFVWIRLIYADGKVAYPAIEVRQGNSVNDAIYTPPPNAVYVGAINAGTTTVTATKDCRCQGRIVAGRIGYKTGATTGDPNWYCRDIGTCNWSVTMNADPPYAQVTFDVPFLVAPMVWISQYMTPYDAEPTYGNTHFEPIDHTHFSAYVLPDIYSTTSGLKLYTGKDANNLSFLCIG